MVQVMGGTPFWSHIKRKLKILVGEWFDGKLDQSLALDKSSEF